jgi:RND family efflux transporter MFP subunit
MTRHLEGIAGPAGRSLAGLAAAALLAAACGAGEAAPGDPAAAVPAVEAVAARHGALPLAQRVHGMVKAANQVAIRPEIEARVVAVLVRSGEAVERGQPLVRLDDRALREQLRHAEASVRLAEAEAREEAARVAELEAQVVRSRALAVEDLVSELTLETQEAQLAAARAAAEQARAGVEQAAAVVAERRADLGQAVVRAPVAGRVGRRNAEVGMLAEPATLLFQVGDLDELIVEVPLSDDLLRQVREGQPVRVGTGAPGAGFRAATLSRISPFLAAESFSTVGEIDLDNRDGALRSGTFVVVDVIYGESEPATLVPIAALWEDPRTGTGGVYVVAPGGAVGDPGPELSPEPRAVTLRPVEVVAQGQGTAAVRGLEPGAWVVTVGQHLLARDGATAARVRATTWERVQRLQALQRDDLLESFLAKQRRIAASRGAEPPGNEEFLGGGPGKAP